MRLRFYIIYEDFLSIYTRQRHHGETAEDEKNTYCKSVEDGLETLTREAVVEMEFEMVELDDDMDGILHTSFFIHNNS